MRLSQGNELVVAVNNADAHLLMTFPDLTCYLVDTGMFYGCTTSPDIKDTKLISSNQETYPSVGKNTGLVFMPCWTWKLVQLFPVVWILSRYLGVICYDIEISLRVTKITSNISVSWTQSLPFWSLPLFWCNKMAILSRNSLKFSFSNVQGFHCNFVGCESLLESNFTIILTLSATNLEDWIDFSDFFLRGYLA